MTIAAHSGKADHQRHPSIQTPYCASAPRVLLAPFAGVMGIVMMGMIIIGMPSSAHAHHVMDGQIPMTMWQGLVSGIAHPIIEIDHFAFILAAGLMIGMAPAHFALRAGLSLLAAVAIGALISMSPSGIVSSFSFVPAFIPTFINDEVLILSSLTMAAILLWMAAGAFDPKKTSHPKIRWMPISLMAAFPIAGLAHGYAYGEMIIGADAPVAGAYLLGFSLVQGFILAAVIAFGRRTMAASHRTLPRIARTMGLALVILTGFSVTPF